MIFPQYEACEGKLNTVIAFTLVNFTQKVKFQASLHEANHQVTKVSRNWISTNKICIKILQISNILFINGCGTSFNNASKEECRQTTYRNGLGNKNG